MIWSRSLYPSELNFVRQHFGQALRPLQMHFRLHMRRWGNTSRAWSLNGGHMALPPACFAAQRLVHPLRLQNPLVASVFAHELMHQWQRLQGRPVTRQAAWLQGKMLVLGCSPYAYEGCVDADLMLTQFLRANVEQQAQMWQDHVHVLASGRHNPAGERMAEYVRDAHGAVHASFRIAA